MSRHDRQECSLDALKVLTLAMARCSPIRSWQLQTAYFRWGSPGRLGDCVWVTPRPEALPGQKTGSRKWGFLERRFPSDLLERRFWPPPVCRPTGSPPTIGLGFCRPF
jgi:hypothetical protein